MHEVVNLDKIKNELHYLFVNYETNLMSLIRLQLDTKLLQDTCSNNRLIRLIRFISKFTNEFCN